MIDDNARLLGKESDGISVFLYAPTFAGREGLGFNAAPISLFFKNILYSLLNEAQCVLSSVCLVYME